MLGNGIEMSFIFGRTLDPLVLGWAPNHFVLGAQLAPGKKCLSVHLSSYGFRDAGGTAMGAIFYIGTK